MNADSLHDFHADLLAIDRFRGGIDWGRSASGANVSLDSCLQIVSQHPRSNESLLDWAESTDDLPERYRAALVIFLQTNDIDLVRKGLLPTSQSGTSFGLAGNWFYLSLLILLGYLGLVLFTFFTAPRIDAIRQDLTLHPISLAGPQHSLQAILINWIIVLPAIGLVSWITFLVWRRRRFVFQNTDLSVSDRLQWVEQLHGAGMTNDAALRFGLDLISIVSRRREDILGRLQSTTGQSLSPLWLSNSLRFSTIRRRRWMQRVLPTFSILLVGGGLALGYGLLVFWPLASLLFDMSQVRV